MPGLLDGIFLLLEDEIKIKATSATNFFHKMKNTYAKHSKFSLPIWKGSSNKHSLNSCFVIRHFSKDVCYSSVSNLFFIS